MRLFGKNKKRVVTFKNATLPKMADQAQQECKMDEKISGEYLYSGRQESGETVSYSVQVARNEGGRESRSVTYAAPLYESRKSGPSESERTYEIHGVTHTAALYGEGERGPPDREWGRENDDVVHTHALYNSKERGPPHRDWGRERQSVTHTDTLYGRGERGSPDRERVQESYGVSHTAPLYGRNERGPRERDRGSNRDNDVESGSSHRRRMEMMMASQLPMMSKYDGSVGGWKQFERSFLARFEHHSSSMVIAAFGENLSGRALEIFNDIPDRVVNRGAIFEILEWLETKINEQSPYEELQNESKLRQLTLNSSTKEYCSQLEYLTAKVYRDEAERENQRRSSLVLAFQGRREHMKLVKMHRLFDSYNKMKAYVIDSEYDRQMAKVHMSSKEKYEEHDRDRHKGFSRGGRMNERRERESEKV